MIESLICLFVGLCCYFAVVAVISQPMFWIVLFGICVVYNALVRFQIVPDPRRSRRARRHRI